MSTRSRQGIAALFTLLLITVLFGFFAGPAMARSEQGDAKAKNGAAGQEAVVTEDTDADAEGECDEAEATRDDNEHPSGKDRHCDATGPQGMSTSNPDGDGVGMDRNDQGIDKPDGDGGDDTLDQDGNNGCGNDDDFDDDNNGWCGKPEEQETAPAVLSSNTEVKSSETVTPAVASAADVASSEAAVLGVSFDRSAEVAPAAAGATSAQVAGVSLARTGGPFAGLAVLGGFLIGAGAFLRRLATRP